MDARVVQVWRVEGGLVRSFEQFTNAPLVAQAVRWGGRSEESAHRGARLTTGSAERPCGQTGNVGFAASISIR